jgi:Nif-specific regulatory protein
MRARLTVESGACEPAAVELTPGVTATIGRSRENSLVVRDDLVSRLHAKVYFEDDKWLIRDFGLNGTKVGGNKLNGALELQDGVEIVVGQVKLRYAVGGLTESSVSPTASVSAHTPPPGAASITPSPIRMSGAEVRATRVTQGVHRELPGTATAPAVCDSTSDTELRMDELTALCRYMTAAVAVPDATDLIRLTLRTILNQTTAAVVGYMNLDPADPAPKLMAPDRAAVDVPLSRRLTERVRDQRRTVWLFGEERSGLATGSLTSFSDAVCLPVFAADGEPLAAVHAYRTGRGFAERDVKFLEAVAAFLTPAMETHRGRRKLEAENLRLRASAPSADELIGDSSAMMTLRQQIGRAAPLPFTVLINGESGSGKELVALALHRHSPREGGPLVVVNCAAIAPTMLEGELFGYRRGAFVGADRDHAGYFEQADEGTLFLDEVAELSMECQGKLLRVIEGKAFRPLGGARDVTVDVRVVAATHRDLEDEVKAGRFRQDLLFRLKVILIRVPPLREHAEDIPELARFFLERLSARCRRSFRLTPAAERKLSAFTWPGNVRQLRALLESSAVMSDDDTLDAEALPIGSTSEAVAALVAAVAPTLTDAPGSLDMDDIETWAIVKAMRQTAGNVSQAARVLGISRDTLHTKLKRKNIDRETVLSNNPSTPTPS